MNKIIKYVVILVICVVCGTAAKAQFRYGPVVGASITNLHFKQDLVTVSAVPGFQAGLATEMMFPGIGFGIDFGLIYNNAGAKVNLGERLMWQSQGYGNERLMLHQIKIPFHLRYKYTNLNGTEEVIAPFVSVGPNFNLNAAHGRCKAMSYAGGDVSIYMAVGAELFKHWQVTASYDIGMTYALKAVQLKDYSARTRQWTVAVSYLF